LIGHRVWFGVMREGLIVNMNDPTWDRWEFRDQEPCFEIDGEPVFEVWYWHEGLKRWFVMSHASDPVMMAQGVVYFRPSEVPEQLRERIAYMEGR
jgi:hypothetical protein